MSHRPALPADTGEGPAADGRGLKPGQPKGHDIEASTKVFVKSGRPVRCSPRTSAHNSEKPSPPRGRAKLLTSHNLLCRKDGWPEGSPTALYEVKPIKKERGASQEERFASLARKALGLRATREATGP